MFDWLLKQKTEQLSPKELLNMVRDPVLTHNLELAKERGELGVLSRQTRDIDPSSATDKELESALLDVRRWYGTYPETDDYPLVEWLEAVIADEFMVRALAKISGGRKINYDQLEHLREIP